MTILAVAVFAASVPAHAANIFEEVGTFGSVILSVDPSARSKAMGGASGAVFWGDVDGWSNPALLGLSRGIRYDYETTEFGGGLEYESRRTVMGGSGLGIVLAGRPFSGMGGSRLDGSLAIDFGGTPEVFRLVDQVKSWSVGASVSELATRMAELRGGEAPAFARFADLAVGFGYKRVRSTMSSNLAGEITPDDVGPAMDWGLLLRSGSAFTAFESRWAVEIAYGYSVLNANDVEGSAGTQRPHRHGTALRVSLDRPALWSRRTSWGLAPLLLVAGAWDRVFVTLNDRRFGDQAALGAEIGLAGVAFVRFGQGPNGSVSSSGFGFALPIGRLARVRYDRARIDVEDFKDPTTDRWSLWLDPLAIAGALVRK